MVQARRENKELVQELSNQHSLVQNFSRRLEKAKQEAVSLI